MSDLELARELAGAAERDVSALRGMGDPAVFADEVFVSHVRQAAEKLFTAWIALQGETYPLSHDLAPLLNMLSADGGDDARFDELMGCSRQTRRAVAMRYAAADADAGQLHRSEAIEQVEALLAAVRRQLAELEGTRVPD